MRKRLILVLTVFLLPLVAAMAGADEEKWFDMENCIFCKNLLEDPALMDHMSWEIREISDGVVAVTTVDPEYRESYEKAQKAMERVGSEMMQGKHQDAYMCGHCRIYGMLIFKGAKMEHASTDVAEILLIRSDDPELQKEIKEYGKRTMDELAKMEAEQE